MRIVEEAAERIRSLEVQGATNVALAAVKALVEQMKVSLARDRESALAPDEARTPFYVVARVLSP